MSRTVASKLIGHESPGRLALLLEKPAKESGCSFRISPGASLYQTRYNFLADSDTFSFDTRPGSDTSSLQSDVEDSYDYWNISKSNDCGDTYYIEAEETWSNAASSMKQLPVSAAIVQSDRRRK